MKFLSFIIIVIVIATGCRDRTSQVPYVNVNISMNINEPQFFDLTVPTGWAYVTGGSKGIIVYRLSQEEFIALERHSPHNPDDECRVEVQDDGVIIEDPCSGSAWLINDGSIVSGPTNYALTRYQTSFEDPILYIYN
ncbi:MAG: hypothetical protein ACOYLH_07220 [Flavobacteriales bacterium]